MGCHCSRSGTSGAFFPRRPCSIHARLCARVRMVCIPSVSCSACPGSRPYAIFQYCEVASGIFIICNGICKASNAAVAPPRRHIVTTAAGLFCRFAPLEKNILDKSRASPQTGVAIRILLKYSDCWHYYGERIPTAASRPRNDILFGLPG